MKHLGILIRLPLFIVATGVVLKMIIPAGLNAEDFTSAPSLGTAVAPVTTAISGSCEKYVYYNPRTGRPFATLISASCFNNSTYRNSSLSLNQAIARETGVNFSSYWNTFVQRAIPIGSQATWDNATPPRALLKIEGVTPSAKASKYSMTVDIGK